MSRGVRFPSEFKNAVRKANADKPFDRSAIDPWLVALSMGEAIQFCWARDLAWQLQYRQRNFITKDRPATAEWPTGSWIKS